MTLTRKETAHVEPSNPLKLQDLDSPSIALRNCVTPKPDTDSRPSSPKPELVLSPSRNRQERVRAMCTVAKDLGERIEAEAGRLGAKQLPRRHNGNMAPRSDSSSAMTGSPENRISSKLTLPRNATGTETPNKVQAGEEAAREGASTYQTANPTRTSERLPGAAARDHAVQKRLQSNRGYIAPHTTPTQNGHHGRKTGPGSPRHQSGSRSIQKMPKMTETCSNLQILTKTERRSLETPPRSRRKMRTGEMHTGETHTDADEDKYVSSLPAPGSISTHGTRHTKMGIVPRLKAQIARQEKELAVLQQKARAEAREAERCMEEVLKHRAAWRLKHTEESNGPGAERTSQPISSPGPKPPDNRLDLADPVEYPVSSDQLLSHDRSKEGEIAILKDEPEPVDDSLDQTEPVTDSTSKWSEVSEFYGTPGMFSRFTLEMTRQYLREEELRSRHQAALLKLREEAVKEKTSTELALLEHQRKCLEMNKEHEKLEEIRRRKFEIQNNLRQEQAEIRHLHNIYKAAHEERKLLLKQQREILQIQQSTAHLQQRLSGQFPGGPVDEMTSAGLGTSTLLSEQTAQDTDSDISDLLADEAEVAEGGEQTASDSIHIAHAVPHTEVSHARKETFLDHLDTKITVENLSATESHSVNQDGGGAGNPSPRLEEPMTETARNNLGNLHQRIPAAEGEPRNHSQVSVGGDDSGDEVNMNDKKPVSPTQDRRDEGFEADAEKSQEDDHHQVFPKEGDNGYSKTPEGPPGEIPQTPASDDRNASLAEFLKVSAKLVQVSESSVSVSDKTEEAQDTESGDSDVFDSESCEVHRAEFEDLISTRELLSTSRIPVPQDGQVLQDTSVFSQNCNRKVSGTPHIKIDGGGRGQLKDNLHKTSCINETEKSHGSNQIPINCGSSASHPNTHAADVKGQQEVDVVGHLISKQNINRINKKPEAEPIVVPLASESFPTSSDFSESETNTNSAEYVIERNSGDGAQVANIEKSTLTHPGGIRNVDKICLPNTTDWQKETKESPCLKLISEETEKAPLEAPSPKDLFPIKSFPCLNEENVTFITDEVLPPIEDTLSELLSPVDEMLSYESAEFFYVKKDSSCPSEELPSLPEDLESIKSNDVDSEDFPSPPEQVAWAASDSGPSSLEGSIVEEIHKLDEEGFTEDVLVDLHQEKPDGPDNQKSHVSPPEDIWNAAVKMPRPFLTLSKAEEDINDPLLTFDIGDRVLVKLSKPGTLRFKGLTAFQEGYWAGVALDRPVGDHDGTYEGVTYFECAAKCGIFVRPRQISHLLCDDKSVSERVTDNHDDDEEHPLDEDLNPNGNGSSEPKGNRSSQAKGIESSEPQVNGSSEIKRNKSSLPKENRFSGPQVNGSSQPKGNGSSEPQGNVSSEPQGNVSSEPQGNVSSEPQGNGSSEPHGSGSSEPHGSGSSEPHGSGSSEPQVSVPSEPHGNVPSEPHGNGSSEPHGNGSSEPHGNGSSEPHGNGSSEPLGNGSSQPRQDVEEEELKIKSAYPCKNENKSRLCSFKSTKSDHHLKVVDLFKPSSNFRPFDTFRLYFQTRNKERMSEAFQKHALFSEEANPHLMSGAKAHRLVLRLCDDLTVGVLCEALERYFEITQRKYQSNPRINGNIQQIRAEPGGRWHFISSTPRSRLPAESRLVESKVDLLVKKIIVDSLEEYNKLKWKKGDKGETPSSYTCWAALVDGVHQDRRINGGLPGRGALVRINIADVSFGNLPGDYTEANDDTYSEETRCSRMD